MDPFLFYLIGMVACLLLIMLGLWFVDIAGISPYTLAEVAGVRPYDIGDIAKIVPYDIPVGAWLETFGSVSEGQYSSGEPTGCDQDGWTVFTGTAGQAYAEMTAGGVFNLHCNGGNVLRLRNNYTAGGLYLDSSHNTLVITFTPPAALTNGDYLDFYCSDDGTNSAITTTGYAGRLMTLDGSTRYSGFGGESKTNKWNYSTEVEFKFVFNFSAHTYDVYVNDVLEWDDKAFASSSCDYIGRITLMLITASARDVRLGDQATNGVEVP